MKSNWKQTAFLYNSNSLTKNPVWKVQEKQLIQAKTKLCFGMTLLIVWAINMGTFIWSWIFFHYKVLCFCDFSLNSLHIFLSFCIFFCIIMLMFRSVNQIRPLTRINASNILWIFWQCLPKQESISFLKNNVIIERANPYHITEVCSKGKMCKKEYHAVAPF